MIRKLLKLLDIKLNPKAEEAIKVVEEIYRRLIIEDNKWTGHREWMNEKGYKPIIKDCVETVIYDDLWISVKGIRKELKDKATSKKFKNKLVKMFKKGALNT